MACAGASKDSEEWTEPFRNLIVNSGVLRKITVPSAAKEGLLSGIALVGVKSYIDEGGQEWGNESQDWFGDGCVTTLRELSLALLKQSYELAVTRYDQPALAFVSLSLLLESVRMASSREQATQILTEITMKDELACTRTASIMDAELRSLFQLPASFSRKALVKNTLMDLRSLLQRKEHSLADCVIERFLEWEAVLGGFGESIADGLELLYLAIESKIATANYESAEVFSYSYAFQKNMDASVRCDELTLSRRRLQSCVARMHKAMGNLEEAEALYRECGRSDEATKIKRVISGKSPFWAHNSIHNVGDGLKVGNIFGAREMQDGSLAIFVRLSIGMKTEVGFYVLSWDKRLFRRPLPFDGKLWKGLRVLPSAPNERLLVLVAPQAPDEDYITSMVSDLGGFASKELPSAQVWEFDNQVCEFDGILNWREIRCRGDIPDRRAADTSGGGCAKLGDTIVVFGGMTPFQGYNQKDRSRSGVFIFCLETKEWLQVEHPYEMSIMVDQKGRAAGPQIKSLPLFDAVSTYQSKDGNEMVMLLRKGKSLINEKVGNEIVPKYAVDVFVAAQGSPADTKSHRKQCCWMLDIPTYDKSGYVAQTLGVNAISIADTLLVMGTTKIDMVQRLRSGEAQGTTIDFASSGGRVSVDALDFDTMEWRGLDIYNDWLLSEDLEASELLLSNDGQVCYLIAIENGRLRFLTLRNAKSIKKSMTGRISEKKVRSKKNTLSYLLEKSLKTRVEPMHSCSSCGQFEAPGVSPFPCCSRCRVTFYCSRECQARHWKVKGGNHKAKCKPQHEE